MRKILALLLVLLLALPLAAQAEAYTFDSELLNLHFTLPEDWTYVEDPSMYVFISPEGTGVIVVVPSDTLVTPEMAEEFSPEAVHAWMQDYSEEELAQIEQILFAKTTDEEGKLYVLSAFVCETGGLQLFYTNYFLSATDGTLTAVAAFFVNDATAEAMLSWFDQMTMENIPKDIMAELAGA